MNEYTHARYEERVPALLGDIAEELSEIAEMLEPLCDCLSDIAHAIRNKRIDSGVI